MHSSTPTIGRRSLVLGALTSTAVGSSLLSLPAFAADLKFVNVLTGGQSGVYYPMGALTHQNCYPC